ncbi:MAG: RNA-binding protein [Candidatus Diapherotrites archaeon]|uniref:RNA-binding protein n=1 Tax=Candidatus Iainarchaeum sp. TaxID=3101447 RepID=A0A7J4JW98_9ARCH|nr:RNA-binding protein [Candidatus Diapherotrites archaeon]HIH21764.1 RNA-binding protein [Candidatus Diapherotrites archaeon]
MKVCSSCNVQVFKDFGEFKCPKCFKASIVRCKNCKQTSKNYTCTECGFTGP